MGVPRVPDDYLRGIGRVSLNSAHVEFALRLCVWRLIKGPPDQGLLATKLMGVRQVIGTLRTLYEREFAADDSKVRSLRDLLREVENAVDRRNLVVHSAFWPVAFQEKLLSENAPWSRGRGNRSAPHDSFFMTAAEIEAVADELHAAAAKAIELYEKLSIDAEAAARSESRR
jgi:hypothetical protein